MSEPCDQTEIPITVRQLGALRVAFELYSGPGRQVAAAALALAEKVRQAGVEVAGSPVALFATVDQDPESVMVRLCIPVAPGASNPALRFFDLEPVQVATAHYCGPYAEVGRAYDALSNWVDEQQVSVGEGISETYRQRPAEREGEDLWIVDVAVRLRRPHSGGVLQASTAPTDPSA